jgi:hypothetical protein
MFRWFEWLKFQSTGKFYGWMTWVTNIVGLGALNFNQPANLIGFRPTSKFSLRRLHFHSPGNWFYLMICMSEHLGILFYLIVHNLNYNKVLIFYRNSNEFPCYFQAFHVNIMELSWLSAKFQSGLNGNMCTGTYYCTYLRT